MENLDNKFSSENEIKDLKVLVAEDDEASALFLRIALESICSEMIRAKTGNEAVDMCRDNPDLDLILMDIKMPNMNGYEATQEIRKFNKDVVIIAQTAYSLLGDKNKSLEAGCTDYISKPISKDRLLEVIQANV